MDDEEKLGWVALSLCSEGRPDRWLALARAAGSALAAVGADDASLAALGASPEAILRLRRARDSAAPRVFEACRRRGLRLTVFAEEGYPALLAALQDPPLALYWRGAEPATLGPCLAVVGARRCTVYGERIARRIGCEAAAAGIVVASGLARGIDAAAHRGALESGLTVAVLAGGLDRIYPGEHRSLADAIVDSGGSLLSEQPPGTSPRPWLFPYRNRVITGLSAATVVVEAGERSGTQASANHALEQGREVFVVPGPIDSPASAGSNRLLGSSAHPYLCIDSLTAVPAFSKLLENKSVIPLKNKENLGTNLGPDEAAVLAAVVAGASTADQAIERSGLDGTRVLALLTALELDGLIHRDDFGRLRPASR